MPSSDYWSRLQSGRLSRRSVLRGGMVAGAGLASAALIGCGSGEKKSVADVAPKAGADKSAAPAAPAAAAPQPERAGMPVVKGTPKKGGTFTMQMVETHVQHDQHTAVSNSEWMVIGQRALELDEWTGKLRPHMVESWEVPDKNTVVLKVRKGIKMHNRAPWNGRDWDANDLAWNLNRIAGNTAEAEKLPKGNFQRRTTLEGMSKVEAVDANTVKITMGKPNSGLLAGITEIRNVMMPKEIVDIGFKDPMKFGGMGPFMITEYQEGVRESYSRHEGYFQQGQPYFDKIVQVAIPDRAAALAAFVSKQVSHMSSPTAQEIKTIQAARQDALLYSYVGVNYQFLMFNFKHKPFQDIRVRKALNLAANREEIGNGYHGSGWGWVGPFHTAFPEAWNEDKVKKLAGWDVSTKAKDLEEAAKLLEAAGFKGGAGLEFEIMHKVKADNRENALRLQAQLAKAFPSIKVTIKAPETAVFDKAQAAKDFQAISNDSTMQPAAALEGFARWHSKGSRNYGGFESKEADDLLDKALGEVDEKARMDVLNTFQEKWVSDFIPHIQFYATPTRHFVQPNIGGFDKVLGPWDSGRGMTQKQNLIYEV
ncbi:MAG: ABC transporter substrate-binding protein [Dehalococcoidia bacterium]